MGCVANFRLRRILFASPIFFLALSLSRCGGGSSGSQNTLPLTVLTSSLPVGVVNATYNASLAGSGGRSPYAWSVSSGSLPSGITLNRAGLLSGTPTATGQSSFTVSITDSQQPPSVATANLTISVNPAVSVTTSSLKPGTPGVAYTAMLSATGGIAPYSWSLIGGSLPSGLSLDSATATISGTPTAAGTSNFTVQVSDAETPPGTATAALSINIIAPPPRGGVMYVASSNVMVDLSVVGLSIASNGTLSSLSSTPETFQTVSAVASPTLPFLFLYGRELDAVLVNPDYSVSYYSSSNAGVSSLSVDPSGADLYITGAIDNNNTAGVLILTADASFTKVGAVPVPNVYAAPMAFTPDGKFGFVSTCSNSTSGAMVSFARAADGTLTQLGTTTLSNCVSTITVSADGKYVATTEVQIYSIGSAGTLTPVLSAPFTVTLDNHVLAVYDLTWDASGSYLLVAASYTPGPHVHVGGVGVLSFSGGALTETVPPTGDPAIKLAKKGSFVYSMPFCDLENCSGTLIQGFDFHNGQLASLPGSPYTSPWGQMMFY